MADALRTERTREKARAVLDTGAGALVSAALRALHRGGVVLA